MQLEMHEGRLGVVRVGDTETPGVLTISATEWRSFASAVRGVDDWLNGRTESPAPNGSAAVAAAAQHGKHTAVPAERRAQKLRVRVGIKLGGNERWALNALRQTPMTTAMLMTLQPTRFKTGKPMEMSELSTVLSTMRGKGLVERAAGGLWAITRLGRAQLTARGI